MRWLVWGDRVLASVKIAHPRAGLRHGLLNGEAIDWTLLLESAGYVHTVGRGGSVDVAHRDSDLMVSRKTTIIPTRVVMSVPTVRALLGALAGSFERWGLSEGYGFEVGS